MPSFTKATASLLLASSVSARTIVQPDVYSKLSEGHNKLREFFQGWSVDESHFAKEGNARVGMDGKSYRALMPDSVRAKSARRFASKDVSSLPFFLRWQSKCCCLNPFTESEADYDVVPMEIGTDNKLIARGDDGLPALLSEKAWNGYQGLQGKNKAKKHFLARYIPVKETHKDANTTSSIGYWEKLSQKEIEASRDENDCKWYGALTGCCCTAFSAIGMFLCGFSKVEGGKCLCDEKKKFSCFNCRHDAKRDGLGICLDWTLSGAFCCMTCGSIGEFLKLTREASKFDNAAPVTSASNKAGDWLELHQDKQGEGRFGHSVKRLSIDHYMNDYVNQTSSFPFLKKFYNYFFTHAAASASSWWGSSSSTTTAQQQTQQQTVEVSHDGQSTSNAATQTAETAATSAHSIATFDDPVAEDNQTVVGGEQ